MQIIVTQTDMLEGIINSQTSDPVALAAQRAGFPGVRIGDRRMSFNQGAQRVFLDLPVELIEFRRKLAYGDRHEMLPFKRTAKGGAHIPVTFHIGIPRTVAA